MNINDIINDPEQRKRINEILNISSYLEGAHKVLQRKNFQFKGTEFITAKIVFQTVKSILDFHCSYSVGNPVSIIGDNAIATDFQKLYKKANYARLDYDIYKDIFTYGNAFEYVYLDKSGNARSKLINNADSYPVYDTAGNYTAFIEYWLDALTNIAHYVIYYPDKVETYSDVSGKLVLVSSHTNLTGLPIHYKSGWSDDFGLFGVGIVHDLLPIVDEIEALLSKMSDSITTLSLNPIGVSIADRVDTATVDKDVVGTVLNLESGGDFKYANAVLDSNSIKLLLDTLISQLYTVAQVPAVVFGQSNIANVSEVSLKLLYSLIDNVAKRTAIYFKEGVAQRFAYIRKIINARFTDELFDTLAINMNYNRPVDTSSLLDDLKTQYDMGAISKQTIIEQSPYTEVGVELDRMKIEMQDNQAVEQVNDTFDDEL